MSSFYEASELSNFDFKSIGKNVLISRKASFYGTEKITIGNNVRIDDFCLLSGYIQLGDYIHISAYSALYGANEGIILEDFSGLSPRVTVFAASDDFGGDCMVGPLVPLKYRKLISGLVYLEKYSQIGSGSIILPAVRIGEGSVTGALTLVNKDLDPWMIYTGIPAKKLRKRSTKIIRMEKAFREKQK